MRRKSTGLCKRVLSISLAAALVVTSLQITVNPTVAKEAEAAAVDATYDTKDMLTETYVKDTQVLKYYKILANAQKNGKVSEVSGKPASEVIAGFTSSDYTAEVGVAQLIDYSGKINFSGLSIGNVSGIGWARAATEIDLSGAKFASPLTEVPANEFASCKKMVKIILPDTVTKIGNNAFESCIELKTLVIGPDAENVVDLTKVDEVGASAFRNCSKIEAVTFSPHGTRPTELKIGEYAFASCGSLKEIEIPIKKAENIGANAFSGCAKLSRAGLQNELTYLSNSLFSTVGKETEDEEGVTMYIIGKGKDGERRLPENITYIGNSCFHEAKLTGLDLSKCTKLTTVKERAFSVSRWSGYIKTSVMGGIPLPEPVVLPESVKELEARVFEGCGVTMIRIPESCSVIGESAFARSALCGITLPKSMKKIEKQTFEECLGLSGDRIEIAAGSELEEIGDKAFYRVQDLGTTAFLQHLKKLTAIGDSAFASCSEFLKNAGGGVFRNLYGDAIVKCGLREIILPDCVKTIGKEVFANNFALRTAELGSGITVIPERAFYNDAASKTASALEKVVVSDGLTDIGKEAFANQSRLHTVGYKGGGETKIDEGVVQFKQGLLTIGEKAFSGCSVQNRFGVQAVRIYLPKGRIKDSYEPGTSKFLIYDYENGSIDNNFCRTCYINEEDVIQKDDIEDSLWNFQHTALTEQGKEKYDQVEITAKEVRITCDYEIGTTSQTGKKALEVYNTTYDTVTDAYKGRFYSTESNPCEKWYIADKDVDAVEKEPGSAGRTVWCKVSGSAVPNVQVAKSTNTNMSNFSYIFGIRNVKLPDSVIDDSLGTGAFENCINLKEVRLSDNLTVIKDNTFSGCGTEIQNPYGSDKNTKYYDYTGLRTVEIPDAVQEIGANAFKGCSNLIFPSKATGSFGTGVVSIGDNAFADCYSLDTIRFPSSLETIGREAFARCAEKEPDQREIKDDTEGSNLKYRYFWNFKTYGTKTVKKGLNEIDFSAATRLQTVGAGAFKQTNVEVVNLARSPLVQIPDSLFEQCTWLKAITFQNDTESFGSNVLKDVISLRSVTLPASATLKSNTISGAFGALDNIPDSANPQIVPEYEKTETVIIPVGGSKRLPINMFNKDNVVSDPAPAIQVDTGDTDPDKRYKNIIGKENAYHGVYAEYVPVDDKDRNAPCSFILYGTEYADEMTVQVVANTYYQKCNFAHGMVSNYTISFKVGVQEQPTERITLSAEEDQYVKRNPAMFVVKGTDKTLYVPNGQDPATKGVTLKANLEPLETTDDVVWTSSNPGLVEISDAVYEKGTGITTAVIKTKEIGDAEITVQSGQKKDTIHVYSVIPVANSNGLTCSTGGTILNQDLKPNSQNDPYGLAVGDADQFAIKLDYGNTDYSEDQIASYGEKIEYTSSDPDVVIVNPDGTFKAQKEGTATITVTALGSGQKLQFYFNVDNNFNYAPTSVQVSGDTVVEDEKGNQSVSVNVDETVSLSAKVVPERASQEVTWQVTNGQDVVSVDEKGVVTGLKRGTGKVVAVAKEKDSVKSKEITVTVKAPAKEFYILCGDVTLEQGKSKTISKVTSVTNTTGFYISPVDSTDAVEWTSSDPAVFTVKSNTQSVTLTAAASGTAILTGRTASGLTATIKVTVPVKKISVTGITVDKEITLNVKKTHQLSPQIAPANANETVTFTYSSSDAKIAAVSQSGLITAVAPGTATINVKTNTNKSASCRVTVNSPATKLNVLMKSKPSAKKIYMAKGQTASLRVDKTPANSTDTLKYKSNKPKIATVDANGSVAAKKKGTAKITVTATSKKKATITIIVSKKEVKAKRVVLKAPKTIKRGKKGRIKVSLKPAKSTNTLSFASSNAGIATVDDCGYVTGVKKGTVTITVTASSGKKAKKKIKIK